MDNKLNKILANFYLTQPNKIIRYDYYFKCGIVKVDVRNSIINNITAEDTEIHEIKYEEVIEETLDSKEEELLQIDYTKAW